MRRLLILPLLLTLCGLGLVACGNGSDGGSATGSDSSADGASTAGSTASPSTSSSTSASASSSVPALDRLNALSITGAVGSAPTVTWKGPMSASSLQSKTLVTGSGATLATGDSVLVQVYIGNGATQKQAFSTYADNAPQVLTLNSQLPAFLSSLTGATVGSRLAITSSADQAFGSSGNSSLGLTAQDPIVIVVDLVSGVLKNASGTHTAYPAWMPRPTTTKGTISGFDFTGVPAPDGSLKSVAIAKGDGPVVKSGQTIVVHYLGEVFGGTKPFDQNFDADPISFGIGTGQVIKGWDRVLVGQTVGSRVVMEIPPALGYGSQGNAQAGITGTDTLVFVVDILAAG